MEEPQEEKIEPQPRIKKPMGKVEIAYLLAFCFLFVCMFVFANMAQNMEERYNECADKFNKCTKDCTQFITYKGNTPTLNVDYNATEEIENG